MKGTIDQVEAFFGAITGVWTRVLTFFAVCWIASAVAVLCSSLEWHHGTGWSFHADFSEWYLVPVGWLVSIVAAAFLHWWGILHILFLLAVVYAIVFVETDLFRSNCLLFVFQTWHTLAVCNSETDSFGIYPLFYLAVIGTIIILYVCWRSWRLERADLPVG